MLIIFVLGYVCIAMEHKLNISKSATALILCGLLWTLLSVFSTTVSPDLTHDRVSTELFSHLASTCEIIIFLIGAMTIVDLIDTHGGFEVITKHIKTRRKVRLLWIVAVITFFLSAVLDNMTTTIIMVMLMRRMISNYKERWIFASLIVMAANSGGATFLPALVSVILPTLIAARFLKGVIAEQSSSETATFRPSYITGRESSTIMFLGTGLLVMVPVFKSIFGLPPYMGVMIGLGIMWLYTDLMYRKKVDVEESVKNKVSKVLKHIDMPTILFFLGILMAVSALQSAGILGTLADGLNEHVHNIYAINTLIGMLSAVIDNVPLVAASMGMYPMPDAAAVAASADPAFTAMFMQDGVFWHLLAYCAGVGGSMLIIGSAAGVVAMGLEKINFIWYFKNMSLLAAIGYFGGVGTFILQHWLLTVL